MYGILLRNGAVVGEMSVVSAYRKMQDNLVVVGVVRLGATVGVLIAFRALPQFVA